MNRQSGPSRWHAWLQWQLLIWAVVCWSCADSVCHAASRRQSAEEWWRLTATNSPLPRVLVRDDEIRFYFPHDSRPIGFVAKLGRERLPTAGYKVSSALLRLKRKLAPVTPGTDGWREPVMIAGQEWRLLATNLLASLTPATPGHAKYYRGLLGDRLLYRDMQGKASRIPLSQPIHGVVIDHRYSIEESLQILAENAEPELVKNHPNSSLFLLIVHPSRSPQPLLIDTRRHRCVWLSTAGLFEPDEPSFPFAPTAKGISALVFESNGLALIRNPVSSVARLGNLLAQTFVSLLRLPLPKPVGPVPPLAHEQGMDLGEWEDWLDKHTATPREYGALGLLIDGERFFPRFQTGISNATDHVHINVYIFDNDDVAVDIADELKRSSAEVKVDVIIDRLASMAAARIPPATPPAKPYVPPASISKYLKQNSAVRVRHFLNSFCSYDHSKVYLVDGTTAWLGGMNIGREYRSEWHDMMVELHGPVVSSLENGFRLNWAHASPLGDLAYLRALLASRKAAAPNVSSGPWIQMRLLPTTTLHKPFAKAVLQSLRRAKSYIYVENPYLFDKQVMANLVRARERGVDVRVILPHVSDSRVGSRAEIIAANYLVGQGVRVFFYPGMTHVKAVLVDGWACVGSGNLNQFSLKLTQEHNVGTSDPRFSARLKHDLFEEDFTHCYELTELVPVEWGDFLADFLLEGI
jgi:cardiolipin synthase